MQPFWLTVLWFRHHQKGDLTEIIPAVQTTRIILSSILSRNKEFRPLLSGDQHQPELGLVRRETATAAHLHIHQKGLITTKITDCEWVILTSKEMSVVPMSPLGSPVQQQAARQGCPPQTGMALKVNAQGWKSPLPNTWDLWGKWHFTLSLKVYCILAAASINLATA